MKHRFFRLFVDVLNLFTLCFFRIVDKKGGGLTVYKLHFPLIIQAFQYVENWLSVLDDLCRIVTNGKDFNLACKWEGIAWHQNYIENFGK